MDLIIDDSLIVEVKACRLIIDEHVAQLLGYLRACRFEHGLLINFGAPRTQIKKYVLSRELGQNFLCSLRLFAANLISIPVTFVPFCG